MVHPDLDELLNVVLPFAQQMLGKYGEFHPIGASMRTDGEVALAGAQPDEERPTAVSVIDMLVAGLRERVLNGEIRAAVICYDSRVVAPGMTSKTDAICLQLEHQSGECVEVFLPYSKILFGRLKMATCSRAVERPGSSHRPPGPDSSRLRRFFLAMPTSTTCGDAASSCRARRSLGANMRAGKNLRGNAWTTSRF